MEFNDLIRKRKSVRSFQKTPVDNEIINEILESVRLAPSWMNRQCWHFIILTDKQLILEINKTSIINWWLKQAPVIIIACADPHLSGERNEIPYFAVDTAIAMQHLILAATNFGLGTCWIGSFNEEKIKTLLEIPPRIRIVALTPLGYPKESTSVFDKSVKMFLRTTQRKNVTEIAHWEHW